MTRNEQYWIDRADRRMDSYTLSAIAQARIINQSYNQLCNYVQSEIAKILRHVGDEGTLAYEYRMKRLTALLERTNKRMQELYGVTLGDTTEFLRSIIPEAYYHTIFDIAQGTGYQPMFSAVNNRLIDQIVNDQWSGMNYSQRIWWNTDKLAVDTRQILTTAAMTGESIYKTSRRLSERFGQSMNNSVRLIRTETTYSCNQAELASYSALDIDRYKFVATLDTRTSSICQELDGKVFETKDAKAGVNLPAMHPNCRSTTIAYFEDGMPQYRIARDKDGNRIRVPADMTYKDWYKKYIENGAQSAPTPARGNNTPKPSGKPQQSPVKPSEGNAVDINVSEPVNPSGAYTDTPIPPKINNQSIDNSVQNDIIKSELKMSSTDQIPPDFSLYEVKEDSESVLAVKKMMIEELGIPESDIDLSGIKNAEVLEPFVNRWKRIQKETGMKFPPVKTLDVIYGDPNCVANFRATENVFYISSKYFNSKKALLATLKEWANNGVMPLQCKTIAYLAEHEAAHIRYIDKYNKDDTVISIHKSFMKSKFSNKNDRKLSEFVADSVAWFRVSPVNTPTKMQELVDYIKGVKL